MPKTKLKKIKKMNLKTAKPRLKIKKQKVPILLSERCEVDKALIKPRIALPPKCAIFKKNSSPPENLPIDKNFCSCGGKPCNCDNQAPFTTDAKKMNVLAETKKTDKCFWHFCLSPRKSFWLGAFFGIAIMGFLLASFWMLFSSDISQAARIQSRSSFDAKYFKNIAGKYAQSGEQVGEPVAVRHNGQTYYYLPLTINGTINGVFPGIILDGQAVPVRDQIILKEIYKYPGLLQGFADDVKGFNAIAAAKVSPISSYCRILAKQETKLDEIYFSGTVIGVLYDGAKLAFDATGLIKAGIKGLSALIKELAKGKVQDTVLSYLTEADTKAVRESASKAYQNAKQASSACKSSSSAWNSLQSAGGKITTESLTNATMDLYRMFKYEALSMSFLREALDRINKYPRLVTKIGEKSYKEAMTGMSNLVLQLESEREYWYQEYQNATTFLEMWAAEQLERVK